MILKKISYQIYPMKTKFTLTVPLNHFNDVHRFFIQVTNWIQVLNIYFESPIMYIFSTFSDDWNIFSICHKNLKHDVFHVLRHIETCLSLKQLNFFQLRDCGKLCPEVPLVTCTIQSDKMLTHLPVHTDDLISWLFSAKKPADLPVHTTGSLKWVIPRQFHPIFCLVVYLQVLWCTRSCGTNTWH